MKRKMMKNLQDWLHQTTHTPLLLQGAKGVGKTWLVRELARQEGLELVEINLQADSESRKWLRVQNLIPAEILSYKLQEHECLSERSLLFLDEVPPCPEILPLLLKFQEDFPTLPIIAAASRRIVFRGEGQEPDPAESITQFYLQPMSFLEFLEALGETLLEEYLEHLKPGQTIVGPIHEKCLHLFREYCLVGGMPQAVQEWVASRDIFQVRSLQRKWLMDFEEEILQARRKIPAPVLTATLRSLPRQLGGKFVYRNVDDAFRIPTIRKSLMLLEQAGIYTRVMNAAECPSSQVNVPVSSKMFRAVFLDIGLCLALQDRFPSPLEPLESVLFSHNGALVQQAAAQLLLSSCPKGQPNLSCWQKKRPSHAAIDFLIQTEKSILPVVVKTGSAGSLKSLHNYMEEKHLDAAVRLDLNPPAVMSVSTRTSSGTPVSYTLYSFPIYMAEVLGKGQFSEGEHLSKAR